MPQIVGDLLQRQVLAAQTMPEIVAQIVEGDVIDQSGFLDRRLQAHLLEPLVDAVLGEPPAVLIALRHLLFRALRREDVGRLAAALPRGEIVGQRAARLVQEVEFAVRLALVPGQDPADLGAAMRGMVISLTGLLSSSPCSINQATKPESATFMRASEVGA